MSAAFWVSYVGLYALIVAESLLLQAMVSATLERRTSLDKALSRTWSGVFPGYPVGSFNVPQLSGGGTITEVDLLGEKTVFVFVAARAALQMSVDTYRWLLTAVQRKFDATKFFLVCSGSSLDECRAIADRHESSSAGASSRFKVLFDRESAFARSMSGERTPTVVAVDGLGCVVKVGTGVFGSASEAPAHRNEIH